jgi:hypothetical protein
MKFSILTLAAICLTGTSATTRPQPQQLTPREAIIDTALLFYRSLDLKSESLMRSVTTKTLSFDGSLFADIGLGLPEPIHGQDNVVPAVLAALQMTTMHNLQNFRVEIDGAKGNFTSYVVAYHYKKLMEPRQNPVNVYMMGNLFEGNVVKEKEEWLLDAIKLTPFLQSGNIEVMGLKQ